MKEEGGRMNLLRISRRRERACKGKDEGGRMNLL
jgi:hypothetical protein